MAQFIALTVLGIALVIALAFALSQLRGFRSAAHGGDGGDAANGPPAPPGIAHEPAVPTWHSPSSLTIIAINLVPLWGVLAQGWAIFPLFVLFWLENIVIILVNALRMLFARPGDFRLWFRKIFLVPFMCFSNGLFAAAHGMAIFAIFARGEYDRIGRDKQPLDGALRVIEGLDIWLPLAAMAATHLLLFIWYYILRGEYRRASVDELGNRPFGRIVLLHVTIIFGGAGAMALGSPLWAMLVLVALKLAGELLVHLGLLKFQSAG